MTLGDPNKVYGDVYKNPGYRMKPKRVEWFEGLCRRIFDEDRCRTFADVACGRGETLDVARKVGYSEVAGYELVRVLETTGNVGKPGFEGIIDITLLPATDKKYDLVTCLDVMEHIPEMKALATIKELWRITNKKLVLLIAMYGSHDNQYGHGALHVTIKDHIWWLSRIQEALGPDQAHIRSIAGDRAANLVCAFEVTRREP